MKVAQAVMEVVLVRGSGGDNGNGGSHCRGSTSGGVTKVKRYGW